MLATTLLDAKPHHRSTFAMPSIWPLISAITLTGLFVGSIFTPWAVVWGALPLMFALIGWFWPTQEETERHLAVEQRL